MSESITIRNLIISDIEVTHIAPNYGQNRDTIIGARVYTKSGHIYLVNCNIGELIELMDFYGLNTHEIMDDSSLCALWCCHWCFFN
jgi:hypothetical protein